jgi:hypothetical protein
MFKYFITILACAALPSTVVSNNDSLGLCKAPLNGNSLDGECQPTAVCAGAGRISISIPDQCPGEMDIGCCVDPAVVILENPNSDPQETENPTIATESPMATPDDEPETSDDLPEITSTLPPPRRRNHCSVHFLLDSRILLDVIPPCYLTIASSPNKL